MFTQEQSVASAASLISKSAAENIAGSALLWKGKPRSDEVTVPSRNSLFLSPRHLDLSGPPKFRCRKGKPRSDEVTVSSRNSLFLSPRLLNLSGPAEISPSEGKTPLRWGNRSPSWHSLSHTHSHSLILSISIYHLSIYLYIHLIYLSIFSSPFLFVFVFLISFLFLFSLSFFLFFYLFRGSVHFECENFVGNSVLLLTLFKKSCG